MLTWRIHYGDGTSFSDADGAPSAAPPLNVQVIAQAAGCDVGRHLISRHDYYWFEQGEWFGGDLFGLCDYLMRAQGTAIVKFGRYVTRDVYQRCFESAANNPDLPKKIAWYPHERRS